METFWPSFGSLVAAIGLNGDLIERYGPRLAEGFLVTCQLVFWSMVIGGLLAIPLTAMRMSRSRLLKGIAFGYIYFFRGTPLLAQTFLLYYGLGSALGPWRPALEAANLWWIFKEAYYYAIIAFALNTAAYQAEIFRGGIESVPAGQWEGGRSVGLTDRVIMWKIIVPQGLIASLRPLGNELILMIKASAVASIITVIDVMGATRLAYSRTFDFQAYMWAAILYLISVEIIRRLWDRMEWRLTRHLRPAANH